MVCVYCGRDSDELKALGEKYRFSKEHILPKSLIGTPKNNLFTIPNVCGNCNNLAGRFIDAPAVKGWFMQSQLSTHYRDYAKIEDNPVLPLKYMGKLSSVTYEGKICDVWIGPTGDSIYHFHIPYSDSKSYPAVVGIPPYLKKSDVDKGFAFLFVVSNNKAWHPTIFRSFIKKFKGSQLFLGNGDKPPGNVFSEIPSELKKLNNKLFKKKVLEVGFEFTPFAENRFLAKMALGMGAKFLGENFVKSLEAERLRKYMWAKTKEERENIPLHGMSFFDPNKKDDLLEFYGWEGGHLITLLNLPDCVALTITLYNSIWASVKIDKSAYDFKDKIGDGISIVIIPALNRIVGPMKYIHFLNHKMDIRNKNAELSEIEIELKRRKKSKPPIKI